MSKNIKRYFIIIAILLVVYNLLVFVIPFPHINPDTFWVAYLGGMVGLLAQGYIAYLAFNNKESLKSMLYGFPLVRIGVIYLIAQLSVSLLAFVLGAFIDVPTWVVLLLEIILLALAVIGLITSETYREEIEKLERSEPLTTKFIYDLRVDAKLLIEKYSSSSIYSDLYKLQQEIQYSDPKSNDTLLDIEDEINRKFVELKELLSNEDLDNAKKLIDNLLLLIKERNYRCKTSKK